MTERVIAAMEFGKRLCEVLGIPVEEYGVRDIIIEIPYDGAVSIIVERYVRRDEAEWVLAELKRFELAPIGKGNDAE